MPMFKSTAFAKTLAIVNSIFVPIFLAFLIDVFYAQFGLPYFGVFALLLFFPLQVFLYSGVLGNLIEIISGEEVFLNYFHVRDNFKRFWKIYVLLQAIPLALHLILSSIFGLENIPAAVVKTSFNFLILYALAEFMITVKYVKPLEIPTRKIKISANNAALFFLLYAAELAVFCHPLFWDNNKIGLSNIFAFLSVILQFLQFIFIAVLIMDNYPEVLKKFSSQKEIYVVIPIAGGIMSGLSLPLLFRGNYSLYAILKALSPPDYMVRQFNRFVWRPRYYRSGKLVAITSFTSNCQEAYKIAKEFRRNGSKVIMGGPHVNYLPEEALEFCDSIVVGEAESVWEEIVRDYENNCLKRRYFGTADADMHEKVQDKLLALPPELIRDCLEPTRGCKFQCHFCTIPGMSGGKARKKPIESVLALVNKVREKYPSLNFIDNNIYNDPTYARELFKALKPLNVRWQSQCTIDIAKNEETLKLAKESGCELLLFGYEISGDSLEKERGGKFGMSANYLKYTEIVKQHGIQIKAHFIFGFDNDTFKDMFRLWKFCFKVRGLTSAVSLLTPLPGSQLFHEMLAQNRVTNLNWRNYGCHSLVFRHPRMNNFLLNCLYPVFSYFTILTTCGIGFFLLGSLGMLFLVFKVFPLYF